MLTSPHTAMDRRLTALHATGLLDSRREGRFDRLTRVVAAALGVPVSLIALVDVDRQFFKSAVGLTPAIDERRQTPLSHSFCRHVVESESPLIVNDSATNALVADNPAIDALGVAAYLGVPIADGDGVVIGSLCAIEHQPRAWTAADIDILKDVAALVEREIADRQASDAMAETERTIRHILNTMPHLVFATDAAGRPDGYNSQWHAFTGNAADDSDARGWAFFCHPDDLPAALAAWEDSLKTHAPFEAECRLRRHDGTYRWMLARAQPVRDSHGAIERWFGSCTDIQAVRDIAEANDMMKRELAGGLIDRLSDKAAYAEGREFEEIRSLIRALRELGGVGE